jgi:hypothetical protein
MLIGLSAVPPSLLLGVPTVGEALFEAREGMRLVGFAIPPALALAYLIAVGMG